LLKYFLFDQYYCLTFGPGRDLKKMKDETFFLKVDPHQFMSKARDGQALQQ
jgi:hypothetical protein